MCGRDVGIGVHVRVGVRVSGVWVCGILRRTVSGHHGRECCRYHLAFHVRLHEHFVDKSLVPDLKTTHQHQYQ